MPLASRRYTDWDNPTVKDIELGVPADTPEFPGKRFGANCGRGIREFIPACWHLASASPLLVWIKPNAGLPEMVDGQPIYRTTPEQFASAAPQPFE
jgi:5-methyltetrahydrofolate--homocysteine methyltransferase